MRPAIRSIISLFTFERPRNFEMSISASLAFVVISFCSLSTPVIRSEFPRSVYMSQFRTHPSHFDEDLAVLIPRQAWEVITSLRSAPVLKCPQRQCLSLEPVNTRLFCFAFVNRAHSVVIPSLVTVDPEKMSNF